LNGFAQPLRGAYLPLGIQRKEWAGATIDGALTSRPSLPATVGRRRRLCMFGRGDVHGERATVQCRLRLPGSLATDGASSEGQTKGSDHEPGGAEHAGCAG
jgi:hypothetical protein